MVTIRSSSTVYLYPSRLVVMLAVTFGLVGALIFGAADFFGGIAAQRISALRVTALVALSGLLFLLLAYPLIGGEWSMAAVALGALSGITGAAAIGLLYACLAIGPMSILSPLTAVMSAVVPLGVGLFRGDGFGPVGWIAIAVALVAVVLVGFVPDSRAVRPSRRALVMAVASGALIGVFLVLIDLTPDDSGLVPLLANRVTNATILFVLIMVLAVVRSRRRARAAGVGAGGGSPLGAPGEARSSFDSWRPGIRFAIVGGFADATANTLLLLALRAGDLGIVSVLTAMYPAGTIILAAVVLRDRIAPTQWVGLALALTAAGMLAAV